MSIEPKPDWQQRVIDEKTELDVKRSALMEFIQANSEFAKLDSRTKALMQEQWEAMSWYSIVLSNRIAAFKR